MIRITLPDHEVGQLGRLLRTSDDTALRHRAQTVLTDRRGRRHPDIATDTGTSPRSVQLWLNAYRDRGPAGLQPRKAPGARPELTPDLAPVLRGRMIGGPAGQGPGRANRTCAELAGHLYKARGLRVSRSAMHAFGAKHGIRPCRPTCRLLRGGPARRATAREEPAALKKGRPRAASSCRARTRPGSRRSRPRRPRRA